jgi:hypothetical protein
VVPSRFGNGAGRLLYQAVNRQEREDHTQGAGLAQRRLVARVCARRLTCGGADGVDLSAQDGRSNAQRCLDHMDFVRQHKNVRVSRTLSFIEQTTKNPKD